jgi:hypothetical protein
LGLCLCWDFWSVLVTVIYWLSGMYPRSHQQDNQPAMSNAWQSWSPRMGTQQPGETDSEASQTDSQATIADSATVIDPLSNRPPTSPFTVGPPPSPHLVPPPPPTVASFWDEVHAEFEKAKVFVPQCYWKFDEDGQSQVRWYCFLLAQSNEEVEWCIKFFFDSAEAGS